MLSLKLAFKVLFTFLAISLGCLVMPYQALASTSTPVTYTITSTAGSNGSVLIANSITFGKDRYYEVNGKFYEYTPSNFKALVDANSSLTLTIKPKVGYVANVIVDSVSKGNISSYTFPSVTANHTINVTFAAETFTITANQSSNGTITPSPVATVDYGATPTYTVKSNTNFAIATVTVTINGKATSYAPPSPYMSFSFKFPPVTGNAAITASYLPSTYTISVMQSSNGTISPSATATVAYKSTPVYAFKPDSGYAIASILVNGAVAPSTSGSYKLLPVTQNTTISAVFVPSNYVITATAGPNGSISSPGSITVAYKGTATYNITPAPQYEIASIIVDGAAVPITNILGQSYTFKNVVTMNQTIYVTFAPIVYTINASATGSGTISSPGTTTVTYLSKPSYTITTAGSNYLIASVTVNGKVVKVLPTSPYTYQFSSVTIPSQTISVVFVQSTYTITATQSSNGSITPVGVTSVKYEASSPVYTIKPTTAGYAIATVTVDNGAPFVPTTPLSYTKVFTDVTVNHTISATFAITTYKIIATVGANGTITPSGTSGVTTFNYGATPTYTITPIAGYVIASVAGTMNGEKLSIPLVATSITYTFPAVHSNGEISATFAASGATIVANFYNNALDNNNLPNLTLFNSAIAEINSFKQSDPAQYTSLLGQLSNDLYNLGVNNILNFYNSSTANNNVANATLLNNATTYMNFVKQYLPSASYVTDNATVNVDTALVTYLVNHLYDLVENSSANINQSAADLQIAVNDVNMLKPYNNVLIDNVGYYDYSVEQLIQDVNANLLKANKVTFESASQLGSTNNSLSSAVAIDGAGNVYVSSPSPASSTTGFGVIYELQKNPSKIVTIAPTAPIAGDHFGRVFAVSGNILVASSEPTQGTENGDARVYVFSYFDNQWKQNNILDVADSVGFNFSKDPIHQIDLSATQSLVSSIVGLDTNVTLNSTVVVGLPGYGKYLIIDNSNTTMASGSIPTVLLTSNLSLGNAWSVDVIGSFTSNNTGLAESFAASGNYVAVGVPSKGLVVVLKQSTGSSTHIFNWTASDFNGSTGYGTSVGISEGSTVTVAIGSPNENKGAGAVWTIVGTINPQTNATTWAPRVAVNLFMPTTLTLAGSEIALNSGILMVGTESGVVMDYKLNSSNLWAWAYTNGAATSSIVNSVTTDGTTTVIGDQYTGTASQQSNVETVQP